MSLQIILGGQDVTGYYKSKTATINDFPGGEIGNCSFTLENPMVSNSVLCPIINCPAYPDSLGITMNDPDYQISLIRSRPVSGQLVAVRDTEDPDGVNIWTGVVVRKPETAVVEQADGDSHYVYKVTAVSAGWSIDARYVTDVYEDKTTGFIIRDILQIYAADFDATGVAITGPLAGRFHRPSWVAERKKVRDCINELTQGEGWTWYIQEAVPTSITQVKKVVIGPPVFQPEQYSITDAVDFNGDIPVNQVLSEALEIDLGDMSQVRNVVYYSFYGEYQTLYKGSGDVTDPVNYDKGLAAVSNGDTAIAPLGNANFASYVKPGAVFTVSGSNYRYSVTSVFPNGNIIINPAWQEASGNVPFLVSNIPMTIKWWDQASITALKLLLDNGDDGVREYVTSQSKLVTLEQGILQAKAELFEKANPMVRMVLKTDTYKLLSTASNQKFYPKAGRAVTFALSRRAVVGTFVQKEITWKDTGAVDVDWRQIWDLSIDFSDRLFALTTIFRDLIDSNLNGFASASQQVIFDVLGIQETIKMGGGGRTAGEVTIHSLDNPWMIERVPVTDVTTIDPPAVPGPAHWASAGLPLLHRAKWGRSQWKSVP